MTRRRHRGLALLAVVLLVCGSCRSGRTAAPNGSGPASTTTLRPTSAQPTFEPTPEVAALAVAMSDEGRRLFYGARPKVLDRAEFALVCPETEHGHVLGCYTGNEIYILRMSRPELLGVMETTAVHEMLHAAYSALSSGERSRVDVWVGDLYAGVTDQDLRELVASYDISEPGQRLNELHSLLPTQLPSLDPRLENHYRRYLALRQRVVAAYLGYRGTLEQLERRIGALHAEIDGVKTQLRAMEARINAEKAELEALERRLEALRARGAVGEFNRLVPQQNAKARGLNALVGEHDELVEAHNAKVREVNGLALEQNQLVEGLAGATP